jgi:hypothetical protein
LTQELSFQTGCPATNKVSERAFLDVPGAALNLEFSDKPPILAIEEAIELAGAIRKTPFTT